MARLRIRIELSRGGIGVPLRKLASVIVESQKFLSLLTEDVRADKPGEWLGFDFDQEILSFTAEYVGAVTPSQLSAFNAAFNGATSLRRDTIAQFLRITDSIGEDELIGFGLYEADDAPEPAEWRCLSRRDALRIADEVKILLGAGQAPHLPEVSDRALGARIFGERRDRHTGDAAALEKISAVESGLTTRIHSLETQVANHSGLIQDLRKQSVTTESSVLGLLSTFESFCEQATKKIEQMAPPPVLPVTARVSAAAPTRSSRKLWIAPAVGVAVLAVIIGVRLGTSDVAVVRAKPQPTAVRTDAKVAATEPAPAPAPQPVPASAPKAEIPMKIDLEATAPTWISLRDGAGTNLLAQMLLPQEPKSVTLVKSAVLRVGNAGGLVVRFNGETIGPLGPTGQVREVAFGDGKAKLLPVPQP
jgi:hypothetical protein